MLEIKTEKPEISLTLDGKVNLTFTTQKSVLKDLETIKSNELSLTIKEWRTKRSLTQNAYMWVLINQLAEKIGDTADNLYRIFIRDYGVRDYIAIQDKAVDDFIVRWNKKGLGWFTEFLRKSKVENTSTLVVYYGSSSYDSKEMSRVVDAVVDECEQNDIPTMTKSDIMLLKNEND